MSLENKLTEEQKERILKKVEKERLASLVNVLLEQMDLDPHDSSIYLKLYAIGKYLLENSDPNHLDFFLLAVETRIENEWPQLLERINNGRISSDEYYPKECSYFVTEYLDSKYVCDAQGNLRSEDEITKELMQIVQDGSLDYKNLRKILKFSKARDLDEILECHNVGNLWGYIAIQRYKSGGWSNLYLIINENETEEEFIKILKTPSKNLDNPNVTYIIDKYGSLEEALKQMAHDEERTTDKLTNTSRDAFSNFEYRPLPQFFRWVNPFDPSGKYITPLLIYEFIEGETIKDFFKTERTYKETLEVLARAAYCLNYIHQKGFIHNDIKSDNFMVGINGRVYLLDLAFSRLKGSVSTIKGVRAYTAPERVLGNATPTEKSDQYGFGAMGYEILTGKMPVDYGKTEEEKAKIAISVNKGEIKPGFNLLKEKTTPELAFIIEKCLAFNYQDRYDSMQKVENELVRLLK